jgi:hypothetical protein
MFNVQEIQKAYSAGGIEVFADIFDGEIEKIAEALLRVSAQPEETARDNYNRGQIAALRDLSSLFRKLK